MGQVAVHFLTFTNSEVTVHAEVTCVSVQAIRPGWGRGHAIHARRGGGDARVGQPMVFTVMDVGEDEGATDLASLVFFGSDDLEFCNTRPAIPVLRLSTNGGIQVRSE
jgi:hypothetical protein